MPIDVDWYDYTPALTAVTTNPVLGTGAIQVGRYTSMGKTVLGTFFVKFGTSGVSAGSGIYTVSLPTPRAAFGAGEDPRVFGVAQCFDNDLLTTFFAQVRSDTDASKMRFKVIDGTGAVVNVTNVLPQAWAASDFIVGNFFYEDTTL